MTNGDTFDVDLTRDPSGAWIATVPTIPGCHTYGWSISEATKRVREALVLWDADPRLARPRPVLPEDLQRDVDAARAALERADAARADVRREMERLARALTEARYSRRDVATILGIRRQTVQRFIDGS